MKHASEIPGCRRFSLADAMICVVFAALWLLLARVGLFGMSAEDRTETFSPGVTMRRRFDSSLSWNQTGWWWLLLLHMIVFRTLPLLMLLAIVLRLRSPRPPLRELLNQPGFLGCLVTPIIAPCVFLLIFALDVRNRGWGWTWPVLLATPVFWFLLACSGRWRLEPGWVDRFGRTVAILWMICVGSYAALLRIATD